MKLEGITTCVDYSDFLEVSLRENLQHLDSMTVVTSHDDKQTQGVCQKYGVGCVTTDVFYEWGDKFNKGRGINLGIAHSRNQDWLIHLDADTVLPHKFRGMLNMHSLEKDNIYGADRLGTKTYENWMAHRDSIVPQHENGAHVWAHPGFPLHARIVHGQYGFCPIGYFQLWHSSMNKRYPVTQGSAEHTDLLFSLQWPRAKRRLLPEMFLYHLESEQAPQGANWDGRKTKFFGPKEKESEWQRKRWHHHKHHPHHHPRPYTR